MRNVLYFAISSAHEASYAALRREILGDEEEGDDDEDDDEDEENEKKKKKELKEKSIKETPDGEAGEQAVPAASSVAGSSPPLRVSSHSSSMFTGVEAQSVLASEALLSKLAQQVEDLRGAMAAMEESVATQGADVGALKEAAEASGAAAARVRVAAIDFSICAEQFAALRLAVVFFARFCRCLLIHG